MSGSGKDIGGGVGMGSAVQLGHGLGTRIGYMSVILKSTQNLFGTLLKRKMNFASFLGKGGGRGPVVPYKGLWLFCPDGQMVVIDSD